MADDPPQINLKILSPSTEIENGISLPDISALTTVKELRTRIQNEIPSKPAVERMRLIYRGRVVANELETLADVFGLENIRSCKDQTLHLVLRELPSSTSSTPIPRQAASPAPRSATVPPNPFRPVQTPAQPQQQPQPNPLPTNPFRPAGQPRPNSQPQLPHHHHHLHHHHQAHPHHPLPQNPYGAIPIPPEVNQLFQHQIAQAMAQNLQQQQQNQPRIPTPNNVPGTHTPNPQSRGGTPGPQQHGGPVLPGGALPFTVPGGPPGNMPNMPPGSTRVIRQEGIGPNGQRWTMTYNNTNITIPIPAQQVPILPRPFPHPPHIPGPVRPPGQAGDNVDQLLTRVRNGLLAARQEMDNVRVLFQGPGGQPPLNNSFASVTPPAWRIERIRQHVRNLGQNLDNVQRGLASIIAEPSLAQNQDVLSLQAAANELRAHAEQLNSSLDSLQVTGNPEQTPSTSDQSSSAPPSTSGTDGQPGSSQSQLLQTAGNIPLAESGPELFLLSSPQGPVGVLFDQRGTFSTAPLVPTLPFQTFTQQFATNRQTLAGLGQQMAQNLIYLPNQFAAAQPAHNQQPAPGAQPQPDQQPRQNQNQNQAQAQAPNPPGENDRLAVIAGHMWLLFKLVCFVYIFAGGGGWYRPLMMGIVGLVVYLAQVGIFENQFNIVRQHFEALLGLPGQHQNRQAQGANAQGQGQAERAQPAEPNRNLTPEQAARRLLQQRQEHPFGWIRERTRTIERAFALFVASLWPGLGERMVQAQEERERAERAAEEERQRQEEEAREQEAQQAEQAQNAAAAEEKKEEPIVEEAPTENSSSSKGKEKAEIPNDGPSSS